jgi:hypothetical protein
MYTKGVFMASNENNQFIPQFDDRLALIQDEILGQGDNPVHPDQAVYHLEQLEATAMQVVQDRRRAPRIYRALHQVALGMEGVTYEPPMNDEQKEYLAGRLANYALLIESATPKKPRPANKDTRIPTDVSNLPTDKPKA